MFRHFSILVMALTMQSVAAVATPILVVNHSFEAPGTAPGTFAGGLASGPTGWSVYNTGPTYNQRFFGVWNPTGTNSFFSGAPDGNNVGVVFLQDNINREAGLLQNLSANLQANTRYTLSVEVGNFAPNLPPIAFNFTGFPGYRVELMAGGVVIASDNNLLLPGEGVFLTSTVSFVTGLAPINLNQQLGIRLVNLNGPGIEVNFDNVRLDAINVPSPGSVGLVGLGLLALGVTRRKSYARKSAQYSRI